MRAIDADAMLARLEEWNTSDQTDKALYNFTLHRILEQPTIEPERKKGEWLEMAGDLQCSECGATYHDLYPDYSDTKFCPNCGSYNGGENDQSK